MIISINKILSKKLKINLVRVIHHRIKIHQMKKKMNKMLMDKKRKRKEKEVNKNMKDFQN